MFAGIGAGKIIKGIANRDEYGGGIKGAIKGIGKAATGGDTDDKLDRILQAVENPINETPAKVLTPLPPGSVPNPGTMQSATIPEDLQSTSMLDPNQQTT
tara:strand:- start:695 stop:994 length:300 start_codon:yes stop_codon:yes gene_type:complete